MKLLYLDPRVLEADPNGVREDPGNVDGLAATISEHGLLQPLGSIMTSAAQHQVALRRVLAEPLLAVRG